MPAPWPRQVWQRLLPSSLGTFSPNKPPLLVFRNGLRNAKQAACFSPPTGGTSLPQELLGRGARPWGKAALKGHREPGREPSTFPSHSQPLSCPKTPEKRQGGSQALEPSSHPTQQGPNLLFWCLSQQGPHRWHGTRSAGTKNRLTGSGRRDCPKSLQEKGTAVDIRPTPAGPAPRSHVTEAAGRSLPAPVTFFSFSSLQLCDRN